MKKTILILLFINSFLNADYLLTAKVDDKTYQRCITTYFTEDLRVYYRKSSDDRTYFYFSTDRLIDYKIESGYKYTSKKRCVRVDGKLSDFELDTTLPMNADSLSYLGLTNPDLNLMFAFSGVLMSSLFLFGLFRFI